MGAGHRGPGAREERCLLGPGAAVALAGRPGVDLSGWTGSRKERNERPRHGRGAITETRRYRKGTAGYVAISECLAPVRMGPGWNEARLPAQSTAQMIVDSDLHTQPADTAAATGSFFHAMMQVPSSPSLPLVSPSPDPPPTYPLPVPLSPQAICQKMA